MCIDFAHSIVPTVVSKYYQISYHMGFCFVICFLSHLFLTYDSRIFNSDNSLFKQRHAFSLVDQAQIHAYVFSLCTEISEIDAN